MEDFAPRTYGTSGLDNRPLFGETSAKVSAGVGRGPKCENPASLHPAGSLQPAWRVLGKSRSCNPASLPLGMFALHRAPRAAWSAEKLRKFWAVGGKPFRRVRKPRGRRRALRGLHKRTFSCTLQVCVQRALVVSGVRPEPKVASDDCLTRVLKGMRV